MGQQVWNGCAVLLSVVGLAVGVAETEQARQEVQKAQGAQPKAAVAVLAPTQGSSAEGSILLTQEQDGVRLQGSVRHLAPGEHGFHIHEFGDLRDRAGQSAGGHYSPQGHKHGGPESAEHHAGDLGNITANKQGVAEVDKLAKGLKLQRIVGRAIVVHAGQDDMTSQPSGNAGARVAVGVIGIAQPKAKTASQSPTAKP